MSDENGIPGLVRLNSEQALYVYELGRYVRITAVALSDAAANAHIEATDCADSCIAVFGPLVFLAKHVDEGTGRFVADMAALAQRIDEATKPEWMAARAVLRKLADNMATPARQRTIARALFKAFDV